MIRCLYLALVLLCLYRTCLSEGTNGGFSVEIIHRDSSTSPFYDPKETKFQRVVNAVRRSINSANNFISPNKVESIVTPDRGEYLMSYYVGTPPFKLYGIVDTGSDIIWLQCKPCEICYNQTTPIFDPSKSNTYKTLPCSSKTCQSVRDTTCSSDDKKICEYVIKYGDGSHSQGDLSVDTFTLGSTDDSSIKFSKIVVGCGNENTVSFNGKSSGIVGLGGGPISLISQLHSSIGGKFSYCLPPMFSESKSSSKLNFGDAAVVSGHGTISTPIVPLKDQQIFYYLTLEALSVGKNRIKFGSSFPRSSGDGNIIIDSGTTLTLLPYDVYSKLESAVADVIKLKPVEDPSQTLSLCYKSTSDQLDIPVITAHFTGADVKLNAINTFVEIEEGIVCLAFRSSESYAIFGNLAQQNFLVGYDLNKNILSFKPTDCTNQ